MTTRIFVGDCREVLAGLPDNWYHCVTTSPPYWGLRDYNTDPLVWGGDDECDHVWGEPVENKRGNGGERDYGSYDGATGRGPAPVLPASQFCHLCGAWRGDLGLEPTVDLFIQHLVETFHEVYRVLRDDGQLFLNISDARTKDRQWCGIPHKLVFALQADGWRYEDEVIWKKPNCMPGSQTNRFTRQHEFVFMLNKTTRAFFDMDAVRERAIYPDDDRKPYAPGQVDKRGNGHDRGGGQHTGRSTAGRSKRSVWDIPTAPLKIAHFAAFPPALVTPCIKAGSSERGACPSCGAGWVRVVSKTDTVDTSAKGSRFDKGKTAVNGQGRVQAGERFTNVTTGWSPTCACYCGPAYPEPVPSRVCDPFGGAGTVALVSRQLGRDCDLIELNESYATMSQQRLDQTPVLTVETDAGAVEVQQLPMFSEVTVQ